MTAILLDLLGQEEHRYTITKAEWNPKHRVGWPPLLQWGNRAFVRTNRYFGWTLGDKVPVCGLDNRVYHEVRVVVIRDTPSGTPRNKPDWF